MEKKKLKTLPLALFIMFGAILVGKLVELFLNLFQRLVDVRLMAFIVGCRKEEIRTP